MIYEEINAVKKQYIEFIGKRLVNNAIILFLRLSLLNVMFCDIVLHFVLKLSSFIFRDVKLLKLN
jgi:hypothetical protein